MSEAQQDTGAAVVDDATVAANAEILAALGNAGGTDDPPAHATPSDARVAAASGPKVGHGTIRLRHRPQLSPRLGDATPGVIAPGAAATREPVGHGVIRLRAAAAPPAEHPDAGVVAPASTGTAPAPVEAVAPAAPAPVEYAAPAEVAEPAPEPQPERVGHGRVRFVDRSLQLAPDATDAAEADIFAVLSGAT